MTAVHRPRWFVWLILPAVLVLGLTAGTLIGFATDRSTTTFTSVRSVSAIDFVTVTKTVGPDPLDHSIQDAEAASFGSSYCASHEAEIMEHVVSERVQGGEACDHW